MTTSAVASAYAGLRGSVRRRPVGWLCGVLCALGLALLVLEFAPAIRVFPGSALLAFVLLLVTLGIGVAVLRRVRPFQAPPRGWAWSGVAWGATAATGCAIVANGGLQGIWFKAAGIDFGSRWGAALTAPLNEELLKVSGVALIALGARQLVRGPLDGFFLGAFTGLGFQVMENWTYAMNSILSGGGVNADNDVLQSFVTRVGLTGLGSHWAMTAVSGTGVGVLLAHTERPVRRRLLPAALCLLTAMAMHWFFDSPLLGSTAGLAVKVAVNFLVAVGFYVVLRRRARRRARAFLLSPESPFSIELLTRHSRRRALRRLPLARRPVAGLRAARHLAVVEEYAAGTDGPPCSADTPDTERRGSR
ncbi:PrsW family intramembrane metalloprotease [Streptomyces sp. 35G-GA-8]|uniref:PrsW family intramembrane metalloprotease n=1 Tax=Streptomyces sp. 35G-GA-8 TaxID=2939434 RepID=UPI00201F748B|nr:PrsW family intramembrane metalloprotease [Streptomyces sp. 35G-GA-8]MCL7378408.1 PrsW family intramembrane metalloprotease [Streptomyces sp. 35G-GA-8]